MSTNPIEDSKLLEQYFETLCNDENQQLGHYVAQKLDLPFTDVSAELPGLSSLVKQQYLLHKDDTDIDIDTIILEVSNNLKETIDYIIEQHKNLTEEKLYNIIKNGIADRSEGLKMYWTNIAPKFKEQQLLTTKKYTNPLNKIEPTIQMIQNLIEPMLRLDSSLLINAYMHNHNIYDYSKKNNLHFLLNNIYSELFPLKYKNAIYLEINIISSLDHIRVIRNAFKHGNYKIENDLCIITEKGINGKKLTVSDLYHILFTIHNIRIFCRTVSGYIFDMFTAKYPEIINTSAIHINTVTTELNTYFLNHGIQIEFSDDCFHENLNINDKIIFPNAGGKKVFFQFKILINSSIGKFLDLSIYIIAIVKCYERIFPYHMIDKNDVMCAILLIIDSEYQTYLFSSFDEIEELQSKTISIAKLIALQNKQNKK